MTKNAPPKYNSFYCPEILIDGMNSLIEKWPAKLNHSRILFLAATYACQKGKFIPKDISNFGSTKKQMVRVTPELLNRVNQILKEHPSLEGSKTTFFVIALSEFLQKCDKLVTQINHTFLAEGEGGERGLVLRKTLFSLFPGNTHILDQLCEETFDAGEKVYCITTRQCIASKLMHSLFDDDELHPKSIYPL